MNMDLDRKYEKFKGGPFVPIGLREHVTMNRAGNIFFNKNFYKRWGRPTGVYLFFNRDEDKIALVPTTPHGAEAFPVAEANGGFIVYASTFCKHFRIRLDGTRRFINPDIRNDAKLLLDLSDTVSVAQPRKKRTKE